MGHVELVSGRDQNSLLSFKVKDMDAKDAVDSLRSESIFTRTIDVFTPSAVRLSVGFWNREKDVEQIADAVRALG